MWSLFQFTIAKSLVGENIIVSTREFLAELHKDQLYFCIPFPFVIQHFDYMASLPFHSST